MSLTNSFHSSAKKHAISDAGKLARIEHHNSRGYYSFEYDQSKIHALIGTPATIAGDVRSYINDTFTGAVDAYNEKQKRKDRIITDTPFDHFESNKNLDIANEVIFQLGAKEFWDQYRHDDRIQTKKGKTITLKSYPKQIKDAMDELFRRQMDAYCLIYETDKDEILARMNADKEAAESLIASLDSEAKTKYEAILKIKNTAKRTKEIRELDDPEEYLDYAAAATTLATLDKLKLIDRTENNQMHIKLINGTAHYDEYSPHAHAVSVCWADGYSNGLGSRVAKSVVLNQWSLSVIQDKMREIAQDFILERPEIFQGEVLAEKAKGRNLDYDKEQIVRQNQERLLQQNQELQQKSVDIKNEIKEDVVYINDLRQNSDGMFDNINYLAANCSPELFDKLDRMGAEMRVADMQRNVFQTEIDRQIETAEQSRGNERQLWDWWHRISEEYKKNRKYHRWQSKCSDARRAYYDARYILDSTHNVFVAAFALLKTVFYGAISELAEIQEWYKRMEWEREKLERAAEEAYYQEDQMWAEYEMSAWDNDDFEEALTSYLSDLNKVVAQVDAKEMEFRERNHTIDRSKKCKEFKEID